MNKDSLTRLDVISHLDRPSKDFPDHVHPVETFELGPEGLKIDEIVAELEGLFV